MINAASSPPGLAAAGSPVPVLRPIGAGPADEALAARPEPRIPDQPKPRIDFDPEVIERNIREAVEHLNKQMAQSGRTLGFSMDDAVSMPIVTVKNSHTGEVIRQIPSEAVVRVAHTLESLKGLLHDSTN
jgi:flagellar protein FlaG